MSLDTDDVPIIYRFVAKRELEIVANVTQYVMPTELDGQLARVRKALHEALGHDITVEAFPA